MQSNDSSLRRVVLSSLAAEEPQKIKKYNQNQLYFQIGQRILVQRQFCHNSQGLTFTNNMNIMESKQFKDLNQRILKQYVNLDMGIMVVQKSISQTYLRLLCFEIILYKQPLLKKELKVLFDCNSLYVAQCYSAYYSKGEIYIVMEYVALKIILEKNQNNIRIYYYFDNQRSSFRRRFICINVLQNLKTIGDFRICFLVRIQIANLIHSLIYTIQFINCLLKDSPKKNMNMIEIFGVQK
ncbi:unnamed protein product [Paramecium sonneborni]|uniref:Uncharacterized protein n=1 Tax=Paramecium sonneborni TaxID=65129 RepID=A0A8S1RUR9_9CILI|nr:unnamed protein product [Paramecium sonneborni]